MGLGIHIQKRLNELGWLPQDLVDKTKPRPGADPVVSQQALSAIMTRDSLRTKYLVAIAEALQLTPGDLLNGKWSKPNSSEPKDSPLYKPTKTENLIFAIVKSLAEEEQEELLIELRGWHEAHAATQRHVRGNLNPVGNARILGEFGTPHKGVSAERKRYRALRSKK